MRKRVPQHRNTTPPMPQMMQGQQQMQNADRWYEAKTDASHPTTVHTPDIYRVIVGFEVNKTSAFTCEITSVPYDGGVKREMCTQDLDKDYGHAFFYVTKNDRIMKFFSFGPQGEGKAGWLNKGTISPAAPNVWNTGAVKKDGYATSKQGTPDYTIGQKVRLFRLEIGASAYKTIIQETDKIRQRIIKGQLQYTAWINDTCAETARDILVKGIPKIPSGTGHVKRTGTPDPIIMAVNPYQWHRNFKLAGHREAIMLSKNNEKSIAENKEAVDWEKITYELNKGEFVLDPAKDLFR
jgi:hypothetical protein